VNLKDSPDKDLIYNIIEISYREIEFPIKISFSGVLCLANLKDLPDKDLVRVLLKEIGNF